MRVQIPPPAPGEQSRAYKKQTMQNFEEEDPKEEEKKAFKVGLATLAAVFMVVLVVAIFFIKGCNKEETTKQEAQENTTQEEVVEEIAPAPAPDENGEVAGEETQEAQSEKTYTIKPGDTLYEIALEFDLDWEEIAKINGIDNQASLKVGDEIIIPDAITE